MTDETGMPDWAWWVLLGVLLALASLSVRRLIELPAGDRPGRMILLLVSAGLGVGLALAIDETHWFLGLVAGVAVVEIGPLLLDLLGKGGRAAISVFQKRGGP